MKYLLSTIILAISLTAYSQDTSSIFYKNQIGIDVLPTVVGFATTNNSIFESLELSYRRVFTPKYYGALRMKFDGDNHYFSHINSDIRQDSSAFYTDTTKLNMVYASNNSVELSLLFSRKFSLKRVNLYTGLMISFSRLRGRENTYEQLKEIPVGFSYNPTTILYSEEQSHIRLGYGLEIGVELLMTKRFSILLNAKAILYNHHGSWNYMNLNNVLTETPINQSDFELLPFSSAMLLYRL